MKNLLLFLVLLSCSPLVLVGCGGGKETNSGNQAPTANQPGVSQTSPTPTAKTPTKQDSSVPKEFTVTVLTGGSGGNYYKAGTELKELLAPAGFGLEVKESGGSLENLDALGSGKAQLAFAQADAIFYKAGSDKEGEATVKKIRLFAPISNETIHIVVNKKAGIKTIPDLKGKKVSIGPDNSGTYVTASVILELNGLKDQKVVFDSVEAAVKKVAKGELDAAFVVSTLGVPLLKDISAEEGKDLELLSLTDLSFITKHKNSDTFKSIYAPQKVPAKTYPWQTAEVETLQTFSFAMVPESLSKEEVYKMAKALYPKAAELKAKNPFWELLGVEEAKKDISNGAPYHDGVKQFVDGK